MRETSLALGRHLPRNGDGLTVQELYEVLRVMSPAERRNSYIQVGPFDVVGISVAQSDQAERRTVKAHIVLDGKGEDHIWKR